jgi:hypothetical protein
MEEETIKVLEQVEEDLQQQITYEKSRNLDTPENRQYGWNIEYHAGFIAGLSQGSACLRLAVSEMKKLKLLTDAEGQKNENAGPKISEEVYLV